VSDFSTKRIEELLGVGFDAPTSASMDYDAMALDTEALGPAVTIYGVS
jgi:hypothetical protein